MNLLQRVVIGTAAIAVGLRLFLPVTAEGRYGTTTDVATTLLQLLGMTVVFGAAFYLASTSVAGRLRTAFRSAIVILGWALFLVALGLGIQQLGFARSLWTIHWGWTSVATAGFTFLSWLTWLALSVRGSPLSGPRRFYSFGALALVVLLLFAGFVAESRLGAIRADAQRKADELRDTIVEGERIGFIRLGMSLDEVNEKLGIRFSSGKRLPNGINSYLWYPEGPGKAWNVFFDSENKRAVIIAYAVLVRYRRDLADFSARNMVEGVRLRTLKGARFGDSRSTIEALYGRTSAVTRLKSASNATNLRLHYPSLRTEFQLYDGYGLLSALVYATGFSPDKVLRSTPTPGK